MNSDNFFVITTQREKEGIIFKDYHFGLKRKSMDGSKMWACTKKLCKASIKTQKSSIIKMKYINPDGTHDYQHPPKMSFNVYECIQSIKQRIDKEPYPYIQVNTFSTLDNERFIRAYQCNEGCSSCCGPKSTIIFTDKRVIARNQQPSACCCGEGPHIDTAIFMRDSELMKESNGQTMNSCLTVTFMILTCTWPLLLCKECCGDRPKSLEVKGAFGFEFLTFKREELKHAADLLSSIVLPMKN
ncbi:hypothetical protein I4U23_004360 [Adineta vaga]|nr:hypothetical protein I4U23_004360 [Adineta vaga]